MATIKRANNEIQNTTQKSTDCAKRTPLKTKCEHRCKILHNREDPQRECFELDLQERSVHTNDFISTWKFN
jgi:hypothetical protein